MIAHRMAFSIAWRVTAAGAGLLLFVSTTTRAQERTQQPPGTGSRPPILTHDDLQPPQLPGDREPRCGPQQ